MIVRIRIVKSPLSVWGKYTVEGMREDGMRLHLNALAMKDLNTRREAIMFVKQEVKRTGATLNPKLGTRHRYR